MSERNMSESGERELVECTVRHWKEAVERERVSHRYAWQSGSQSGHCCFEATVVDTSKPEKDINGQKLTDDNGLLIYFPVCECFDEECAVLICASLNEREVARDSS